MFNETDISAIYLFLTRNSASLSKPDETNGFGDVEEQRTFDDNFLKWFNELAGLAKQNDELKNFQKKMFTLFFNPVEQYIATINSRINAASVDIEWYRRGQVISSAEKASEVLDKKFTETFLSELDRSRIRRMMFLNFMLKIIRFCHQTAPQAMQNDGEASTSGASSASNHSGTTGIIVLLGVIYSIQATSDSFITLKMKTIASRFSSIRSYEMWYDPNNDQI